MARQSVKIRPRYLWLLIAFALGLFAGLIIGWGIWPVQWKNSLPQDLRPAERNAYLSMVAESYAASGDLQLAEERLASWPRADLAKTLAELQDGLIDTNAKLAGDLQSLVFAMNLSAPLQPAPNAAGQTPQQPGASNAPLKTICTSALWVLLVLAGLVGAVILFTRWRNARGRQTGATYGGAPTRPVATYGAPPSDGALSGQGQPVTGGGGAEPVEQPAAAGYARAGQAEPEFYEVEPGAGEMPAPGPAVAEEAPRPAAPSAAPEVARTGAVAAGPVKLADELAIYQMGEPGYDEAFDVNDVALGYVGECGLQSNDLVGRDRDRAVALRVWLYDQRDSSTQLKVLMSEGAYRDTALRSQQAGGHEALQVKPGLEFTLESHALLLRGRVEKVDYTDQEPYRSVFAELQVRMQVYRKL